MSNFPLKFYPSPVPFLFPFLNVVLLYDLIPKVMKKLNDLIAYCLNFDELNCMNHRVNALCKC